MPCHRPPPSPTSTGPPHTHRAHEPSHFVCSICHVTPCPPHHPTQPLTGPLQQVQTTHSADRTKDKPFSASAASFSSPSPHTSRHLSEKKSPLKPKPVWGLDAGKRGPFLSMLPRHSGKQHYLSLAPSSAPDKRGFPLDLLFKTRPKTGIRRFQINELEPSVGRQCPCPLCSARCPHTSSCLLRVRPARLFTVGFVLLFNLSRIIP